MRVLRPVALTLWFVVSFVACQPMPSIPTQADIKATNDNAIGLGITYMSKDYRLPAGSSTSFALELTYPANKPPQSVTWTTENISSGLTATIVGGAAPWQRRLIVTTESTLAAGSYTLDVRATTDTMQSIRTTVKVDVTACTETVSGSVTQAINSNLVELITAGKPNVEHGLLVPVQICSPKHLSVKLTSATAEDGSNMTTLPTFYMYRSEVYPAPDHITAHPLPELYNVQVPTIAQANSAGQLETNVGAGLYLLIFERDHYGATLTPQTTPASVTYMLTVG